MAEVNQTLWVSARAAVEIRKRAVSEGRTVVAVIDRLLQVDRTESETQTPAPNTPAPRLRAAPRQAPAVSDSTEDEVVLCECGHPSASHPRGGKCFTCKGGCLRYRPVKG